MPFGTACARLKKNVFFDLVKKVSLSRCFRCGKFIETAEELSIDHKVDWMGSDISLFWDIENIAFSHRKCNKPRVERMRKPLGPNGERWCAGCKNYLPYESFSKDSTRWNGVNWRCKNCQKKARNNDEYRKRHAEAGRKYYRNKIKEVS